MLTQHGQSLAAGADGVGVGRHGGDDLCPATVRKNVACALLAVAAIGTVDLVVDKADVELAIHAVQGALGGHLARAVVVRADVGRHMGGVHRRVNADDGHTRRGRGIDGGSVLFIVDGGKDNGLCTVLDGLFDHAILFLVVFLAVGGRDGQLHIVLGGGSLRAGKDSVPELRILGFCH